MSDDECRKLLRLLHQYVMCYGSESPETVSELGADLAMSMDRTTDEDDRMRREIEEVLGA